MTGPIGASSLKWGSFPVGDAIQRAGQPRDTVAISVIVAALLSVAAACTNSNPAGPGAPPTVTILELACAPQAALAGELIICIATGKGSTVHLNPDVTWSSSAPDVLVSLGTGLFMGKSDVQGTITAAYQGQTVSAQVTATLQDVLRTTAAAYQGSFRADFLPCH